MPLTVLNWNIQNFGLTRSADADRIAQVARVIRDANAHIVCIQEIQVSSFADAATVMTRINNALVTLGGAAYNYILTPSSGFEMYAYLYRGGANLQALTLGAAGPGSVNSTTVTAQTFVAHAGNTTAGHGPTGMTNYFPLFDYERRGNVARPPGLGIFRYAAPMGGARYLCILNWHNDATNTGFIRSNVGRLAASPLLTNASFNVTVGGGTATVDHFVIAADFNDALAPNPFPGYQVQIAPLTHLYGFDQTKDDDYGSTVDLRDALYDNLVTRMPTTPNALTPANPTVRDEPLRLHNERIGNTKTSFDASDILAQAQQQLDYRVRIVRKLNGRSRDVKGISKTSKMRFRNLLDTLPLGRIRTQRLTNEIGRLPIPPTQRTRLVNVATSFITAQVTLADRWATRAQNMNALRYNDCLFLMREWMSDHLPMTIQFTP